MSELDDKNMNELRGMPKDIDLLINTTKSLVKKYNEGGDISERMVLIERLVGKVSSQYLKLLDQNVNLISSTLSLKDTRIKQDDWKKVKCIIDSYINDLIDGKDKIRLKFLTTKIDCWCGYSVGKNEDDVIKSYALSTGKICLRKYDGDIFLELIDQS